MRKIKVYNIVLAGLSGFLMLALIWLVDMTAPERFGTILFFYILSGSLVFCVTTLADFYLLKFFGQREMQSYYFRISSRQGLWLTLLFIISLFLLSRNLFSWLNALFLVLALVFLESYIITKPNDRKS